MNYVIAILADRIQAEAAYSALEAEGLPQEKITIVGKGYKSADEYGFLDPNREARKRAKMMAYWLVPFGFIAGYGFNTLTSIQLFPWAGVIGNHIIGGIFGAIGGAMGGFFVGGGVGLSLGSGDALPYRNRINAGKYLVIVNGPANLTNQATRILKTFEPENIQGYVDPGT
jgi:hypothetical protein